MSDLFTDLVDGSGRDYFYDLESAPGGLTPDVGALTLQGLAPTVFEQITIFRSPAPATLTLNGLSFTPEIPVAPATAALSLSGLTPTLETAIVVTPAIPAPTYDIEDQLVPTILFIQTVTPPVGDLTLSSLELNVSQGGNIATITPQVGQLSLAAGEVTTIFYPVGLGALSINGLAPTLEKELYLGRLEANSIPVGALTINGLTPTLEKPFSWIDVEPPPPSTWTTTTGVAA